MALYLHPMLVAARGGPSLRLSNSRPAAKPLSSSQSSHLAELDRAPPHACTCARLLHPRVTCRDCRYRNVVQNVVSPGRSSRDWHTGTYLRAAKGGFWGILADTGSDYLPCLRTASASPADVPQEVQTARGWTMLLVLAIYWKGEKEQCV